MKNLLIFIALITFITAGAQLSKEERQAILDAKKRGGSSKVIDSINDLNTLKYPENLSGIDIKASSFEINDRNVVAVFDVENKTKNELYTTLYKWVSINYVSANSVIQMADKESGTIIVKGTNKVVFPNPYKKVYPKNDALPYNTFSTVNHLIEINVRDNKYRINYTILDIDGAGEINNKAFECVNLNNRNEVEKEIYANYLDDLFKSAFIGKKKRRSYIEKIVESINDLNENLLNDIRLRYLTIVNYVESQKKSDW